MPPAQELLLHMPLREMAGSHLLLIALFRQARSRILRMYHATVDM